MIPRPYQQEAIQATYRFLRTHPDRNPAIVLPTGAGKSLVMANIAWDAVSKWNGRVLILAAVKELLQQTHDTIKLINPHLPIGLYSAGLGRRDKQAEVLVAGIQSIYKRACEFEPWNLILVDEAHQIPPDGDGMYRQFLNDCRTINPKVRLVGLTATPYRTSTGLICDEDNLLNEICYEVGVRELIVQGFLSPLVSKTAIECNTSGLHIRRGEFVADEAEKLMLDVVGPACREVVRLTESRRSVLIFCQSVKHANTVRAQIEHLTSLRVGLITGESLDLERAEYIAEFRSGAMKYLVNINVLTTGFDAPNVDCVCLLRPTVSPGLYYQMVGRGFRKCSGKEDCLVLDFGGNVKRHGPVDMVQPVIRSGTGSGAPPTKTCPDCKSEILAGYSACPDCGYEFQQMREPSHEPNAANDAVLSETTIESYDVIDAMYYVHNKRRAEPGDKPTLRCEYAVSLNGIHKEWVCIEHRGFAGNKARAWWQERSNDPFPESVELAAKIANAGGLAEPLELEVHKKPGEKFPRTIVTKLGEKPEATGITLDAEPEYEPGSVEVDEWGMPVAVGETSDARMSEEEVPF